MDFGPASVGRKMGLDMSKNWSLSSALVAQKPHPALNKDTPSI